MDERYSVRANQAKWLSVFQRKLHIITEQMPEFPGGRKTLYKFLMKNISIASRHHSIESKLYFLFVVEKSGKVKEWKIFNRRFGKDLLKEELSEVSRELLEFILAIGVVSSQQPADSSGDLAMAAARLPSVVGINRCEMIPFMLSGISSNSCL